MSAAEGTGVQRGQRGHLGLEISRRAEPPIEAGGFRGGGVGGGPEFEADAKSPCWVQGLGELVSHREEVLLQSRGRAVRALTGLNCSEQPHMGPLPTPSAHGSGGLLKLRHGSSFPSCTLL